MTRHLRLQTLLAALILLPLGGATPPPASVDDPAGDERVTLRGVELPMCDAPAADVLSYSTSNDGDNLTVRIVRAQVDAPLACAGAPTFPPKVQSGTFTIHARPPNASWAAAVWVSVRETANGTQTCHRPPLSSLRCRDVQPEEVRDGDAWVLTLPLHGTTYPFGSQTPWAYDMRGGTYPAFVTVTTDHAGGPLLGSLVATDGTPQTPLAV